MLKHGRLIPVRQTPEDKERGVYTWRPMYMPEGGGTRSTVKHGIPLLWSTFLLALVVAIITVGTC